MSRVADPKSQDHAPPCRRGGLRREGPRGREGRGDRPPQRRVEGRVLSPLREQGGGAQAARRVLPRALPVVLRSPSAYPGLPDDPSDLLDFTLERDVQIYEFLWQNRAFLRILPTCQGELRLPRRRIPRRDRRDHAQWVDYWRREGIFRADVDPDLAATLIGGAYHELSMRMLVEEKRPRSRTGSASRSRRSSGPSGHPKWSTAVDSRNQRVSGTSMRRESPRPRTEPLGADARHEGGRHI